VKIADRYTQKLNREIILRSPGFLPKFLPIRFKKKNIKNTILNNKKESKKKIIENLFFPILLYGTCPL
jgi:hypothetical protein